MVIFCSIWTCSTFLLNWGHAKEKYRCPDDDSTEYRGYEVCIESAFAFWGHDALNSSPGKEFHLKMLRSLKKVIRLGLKLNSVDICHEVNLWNKTSLVKIQFFTLISFYKGFINWFWISSLICILCVPEVEIPFILESITKIIYIFTLDLKWQ